MGAGFSCLNGRAVQPRRRQFLNSRRAGMSGVDHGRSMVARPARQPGPLRTASAASSGPTTAPTPKKKCKGFIATPERASVWSA
jgi:hypothetical protein